MTIDEEWREIPGYEGFYEVSNLGRIRSVDRPIQVEHRPGELRTFNRRGKLMKPFVKGEGGYLAVELRKGGSKKQHGVANLVALAFIGPPPEGYATHPKDGDPLNVAVANLRYGPKIGKPLDSETARRIGKTGGRPRSKLSDDDVAEIRKLAETMSPSEIARRFNISAQHAHSTIHGRVRKKK